MADQTAGEAMRVFHIQPDQGETLDHFCRRMVGLANTQAAAVRSTLDGIQVTAWPETTVDELLRDLTSYTPPETLPPHSERQDWPASGKRHLPNQNGAGLFGTRSGAADSCLSRLKKGEPFFVLRAQDFMAAPLVKMWAEMNALNPGCPPEKLKRARLIALEMDRWPHKKWAD